MALKGLRIIYNILKVNGSLLNIILISNELKVVTRLNIYSANKIYRIHNKKCEIIAINE